MGKIILPQIIAIVTKGNFPISLSSSHKLYK